MIRKTLILATLAASIATAALADAGRQGQFTGASNHVTTGMVEIIKDGDGYAVKLGPNFSLDGAPDPKVGFGRNGTFVDGTLIGKLQSLNGEQVYRIPAGIDVSSFTDVFIWCEQFSVPLGSASLR